VKDKNKNNDNVVSAEVVKAFLFNIPNDKI
jgi:hypothetical protein